MQGVAINFVKSDDIRILRDIEQYYSTQVDEMVSAAYLLLVQALLPTIVHCCFPASLADLLACFEKWVRTTNIECCVTYDTVCALQPMNVADLI